MRRQVFRRQTTSLALFPFLAVLICTMGALIVLLVLILQQTRSSAAATAEAEQAAAAETRQRDDEELKQRRQQVEDAQWRAQVLDEQRRQQAEDLARGRLELSHLEDHIRRLQDQAKQLGEELKQSGVDKSDEDRLKMVEELARLAKDIEAARKKLQEAQVAASKKNKSFTIIPYEGRQGTRRRPIYIECAEEGIILHPEGIVFQPNDFSGPLGPGNPLDAALRTVREYLARYGDPAKTGEPYPLLIVRPNGAVAYAMARAAMKSWDDEFGYELIDGDMNLQFPPSDPQLEQLLMRTLKDARHRQTVLAAAMPSRYKGAPTTTEETVPSQSFAAAPSGSPRTPSQGGLGAGGSGVGTGAGTVLGAGTGGGTGGSGSGVQRPAAGRLPVPGGSGLNGGGRGPGSGQGTGSDGGTGSGGGSLASTGVGGSARGYADRAGDGGGGAASGAAGATGSGGTGGSGGASGSSGSGRAGGQVAGANSGGVGGAGGAEGGAGAAGASGGAGGDTAGPGMFAQGGSSAKFTSGTTTAGGSAGSSGASGGSSADGATGTSGARGGSSRGSSGGKFTMDGAAQGKEGEWALPGKSQRATAITRPIRVRCEPNRLVILPEKGDSKRPVIVLVPKDMNGSLDDFVSAVRKHMEGWGLAVAGGYWKPVLNVTVAPGGDAQFTELDALLRGSGMEVVRK